MTDREKEQFYRKLGENIKKAREKIGLKQSSFAQTLQISRASIVNLEKGRQRPPLHLLYEIANATKVSFSDLMPKNFHGTSEEKYVDSEQSWEEIKRFPQEDQKKLEEFLKNISK